MTRIAIVLLLSAVSCATVKSGAWCLGKPTYGTRECLVVDAGWCTHISCDADACLSHEPGFACTELKFDGWHPPVGELPPLVGPMPASCLWDYDGGPPIRFDPETCGLGHDEL